MPQRSHRVACGPTPWVIGIGGDLNAKLAKNAGHIALGISRIEVFLTVENDRDRTNVIIGEVHAVAAPGHFHQLVAQIVVVVGGTIDRLGNALDICQPCPYYSKAGLAA